MILPDRIIPGSQNNTINDNKDAEAHVHSSSLSAKAKVRIAEVLNKKELYIPHAQVTTRIKDQ